MNPQPENEIRPGMPPQSSGTPMDVIGETLQQLTSASRVSAVFGEPQTVGDRTVIPAAEVFCTLGFGMGAGGGKGKDGDESGYGSGGGGGGMARGRPIAAIVVEPEGVHVRPIVDVTQILLAALTSVVFVLFWIRKLAGPAKDLERGGTVPPPRRLAKLVRRW